MPLITRSFSGWYHFGSDSVRFEMRDEAREDSHVLCSVSYPALRRLERRLQLGEENLRQAFDKHRALIERIASEKFDAKKIEASGEVDVVVNHDDVSDLF